jgi:hypothetical protein
MAISGARITDAHFAWQDSLDRANPEQVENAQSKNLHPQRIIIPS